MTNNISENLILVELLGAAQVKLTGVSPDEDRLREVATELSRFASAANEASLTKVGRGADVFTRVLELAACWCSQFHDDPGLVEELIGFVNQYMPVLEEATESCQSKGDVDAFVRIAEERWEDYLSLLEENDLPNQAWGEGDDRVDDWAMPTSDEENEDVPLSQIELLLSALTDSNPGASDSLNFESDSNTESAVPNLPVAECELSRVSDEAARLELANDREMLEAYLDDALRCLSSMEQAALAMESAPEYKEPVAQFCRELHTLKGASATVGFAELASYLHELESSLQILFDDKSTELNAEPLFEAVDRVRAEIESLQKNDTPTVDAGGPEAQSNNAAETMQVKPGIKNFSTNDDSSIRIRAVKLDRLMDMLAELVVLRNRRESHVAEFNVFNEELARCASRLSFAEDQAPFDIGSADGSLNPFIQNSSCTFSEVAKDITAVSKGMRELQKPVSLDNAAISRFIRDFRQELMQLRRIPVSGLFHRLQRAARDAAKSESKQVQIVVVGENAGLEQEIQERLYESLLHVVRNSVSHGIESEDKRIKAGKDRLGTITLEASSSAQLLIIEVRDDGNGLDYEAIRNRAIDKSLLSPNQRPSHADLAKLIFHPGFSTREQASAVSGRGVGMDIVAKTIEQLHGRVDVDSVSGQGTTIRLSIPLRTGIEHVMVFRSGGQLFALPMQSVTAAKSSNSNIGGIATLSLSSDFSQKRHNPLAKQDVLLLRRGTEQSNCHSDNPSSANTQIALAVDELIGPEEVVVRGLPNLLKHHPLFCGITLSGSGEKVLLLDSDRVLEFCHQSDSSEIDGESESSQSSSSKPSDQRRALVVDDSLTARRVLVKILQQHGFVTVEAGDGIEAIERLHKEEFDLVLTDLDMPRFGGLELLSDIQSSRYCDSPVVVVSSRNEEVFRTKAMDVGASDYVTKPISELSIKQLLEKLHLLPEVSKG